MLGFNERSHCVLIQHLMTSLWWIAQIIILTSLNMVRSIWNVLELAFNQLVILVLDRFSSFVWIKTVWSMLLLLCGANFVTYVLELCVLASMLRSHWSRMLTKVSANTVWIVIMEHQRSCLWTKLRRLVDVLKINIVIHVIILVVLIWFVKGRHHIKSIIIFPFIGNWVSMLLLIVLFLDLYLQSCTHFVVCSLWCRWWTLETVTRVCIIILLSVLATSGSRVSVCCLMWVLMSNAITILLTKWFSVWPIHRQCLIWSTINIQIPVLWWIWRQSWIILSLTCFVLIFYNHFLEKIAVRVLHLFALMMICTRTLFIASFRILIVVSNLSTTSVDTIEINFVVVFIIFKCPQATTRSFFQQKLTQIWWRNEIIVFWLLNNFTVISQLFFASFFLLWWGNTSLIFRTEALIWLKSRLGFILSTLWIWILRIFALLRCCTLIAEEGSNVIWTWCTMLVRSTHDCWGSCSVDWVAGVSADTLVLEIL